MMLILMNLSNKFNPIISHFSKKPIWSQKSSSHPNLHIYYISGDYPLNRKLQLSDIKLWLNYPFSILRYQIQKSYAFQSFIKKLAGKICVLKMRKYLWSIRWKTTFTPRLHNSQIWIWIIYTIIKNKLKYSFKTLLKLMLYVRFTSFINLNIRTIKVLDKKQ